MKENLCLISGPSAFLVVHNGAFIVKHYEISVVRAKRESYAMSVGRVTCRVTANEIWYGGTSTARCKQGDKEGSEKY